MCACAYVCVRPDVIISEVTAGLCEVFQKFVNADLEVLLKCFLHYPKELLPTGRKRYCQQAPQLYMLLSLSVSLSSSHTPVFVVNESIVEDTVYFMHP